MPENSSLPIKMVMKIQGVRYANKKGQVRSIELYSPHKTGPHQQWHWQLNKWHSNGIPNGPANFANPYKRRSFFGRSFGTIIKRVGKARNKSCFPLNKVMINVLAEEEINI